jgi:hypothetical protein
MRRTMTPECWLTPERGGLRRRCAQEHRSVAAEIRWMAVDSGKRGQGLGSALLRDVLGRFGTDGVGLGEVKTLDRSASYPPYVATRAFWERNRFVQVDTINPLLGWQPGNRRHLRGGPPANPVTRRNASPAAARTEAPSHLVRPADEGNDEPDHPEMGVEPFRRRRSCGETSSTAAPRPFPGSLVRPHVCQDVPIWAQQSPAGGTYFAEITPLTVSTSAVYLRRGWSRASPRRSDNEEVDGSSPSRPTQRSRRSASFRTTCFLAVIF